VTSTDGLVDAEATVAKPFPSNAA